MIPESVRRRPARALRAAVAWYSGYRQAGGEPAVHRGLPGPHMTFIVTFGDPLTSPPTPTRRRLRLLRDPAGRAAHPPGGGDPRRAAGRGPAEADGWEERFAALDAVLARHHDPGAEPGRDLAHAWQRLLAAGGRAR